jgi:hypothetical protein
MNDIYHWNTEIMVKAEMEDFKREMDMVQLLHEAGLSRPSLLERMELAIGNALVRLGEHRRKQRTLPRAYQIVSGKIAA